MGIQDDEMWSHIYVREERAMEADELGRAPLSHPEISNFRM
jgi:hypothetical protein